MARLDEAPEAIEQALNIGEVQTGGRFIKNVEIVAASAHLAEFSRELHALRLATGENRGGVAEFQITEAKFVQDFELSHDRPLILEEAYAFLDREFQQLGDVAPLPGDFQRLFAITASFASGTGDLDIRHEGELRYNCAVACAFFAAPAFDIKAEGGRTEATLLCFVCLGKKFPDRVVYADVSCRIRTWRAPNR